MSEDVSDSSPKWKKKQPCVLSDSESDNEVPSQGPRRHLAVNYDDEDESSDSSVGAVRRTLAHPLPSSSDSEDSHDETGANVASDSSDGQSDKCPICLARLAGQNVGVPESCEHMFCVECITEWARNVNTCPVDRMTFAAIVVREGVEGKVLHTKPVSAPSQLPDDDLFEQDLTVCQVCNNSEDEATMLLCDTCDEGFHMRCLSPPLHQIPDGEWHCPNCTPSSHNIALSNALVARVERHLGRLEALSGSSRRRRRRATRRVVVEYDVRNGTKVPVKKKTAKRKIKKRKTRRKSARTAARRTAVRATVRERLVAMSRPAGGAGAAISAPTLSLFGNRDELEYFSEDEGERGGGGGVYGIARRPTASLLSAYRQARRKMITIQSPPRVSNGLDILSDILENQTLLHSKNSVASITVDGKVMYKVHKKENIITAQDNLKKDEKLDLSEAKDSSRKAPSYPGNSRGGNWNGGYRGDGNRGGYGNSGRHSYGGGYHGNTQNYNRGNSYQPYQGNNENWGDQNVYSDHRPREHELDNYNNFRNRQDINRQPPYDVPMGRGAGYNRSMSQQTQPGLQDRLAFPIITPRRHTFSSLEQNTDALDMRMAPEPDYLMNREEAVPDLYGDIAPPRQQTPPRHFEPLEEPPIFKFQPLIETEKSEDEKSDSGLIIDTEKYDPTNPTHDESSGDEGKQDNAMNTINIVPEIHKKVEIEENIMPPIPDLQLTFDQVPPKPISMSPLRVQTSLLDKAVQQAISEHRVRVNATSPKKSLVSYKSDDDEDGDCPNFSIYSATSVNIANNSELLSGATKKPENEFLEREEDLVQEDDDIPMPEEPKECEQSINNSGSDETPIKEKSKQDDYDERISKKCPITPNKRNPIKIKLHNTQALIKRNVNLEDENSEEGDTDTLINDIQLNENTKIVQKISSDEKNIKMSTSLNHENNNKTTEHIIKTPENQLTEDDIEDKIDSTCDKNEEFLKENSEDESDGRNTMCEDNLRNIADAVEKMTESISESEDERSYTPCLDENKSVSFENEKENAGLEGLETELISEEEENEMFSDMENKRAESVASPESLNKESVQGEEEGEITDKNKELPSKQSDDEDDNDEVKKKKKKVKKDKSKSKGKKSDVAFKKLSKNTKERNYRDKDDKIKTKTKDRKKSDGKESRDQIKDKKKEKRKDMERYDVRNIVSDKKRCIKDAFGRDTSRPRSKSPSLAPSMSPLGQRRSISRGLSPSLSNERYTPSLGRRSFRRSSSNRMQSTSPMRRPKSPHDRKSISPRTRTLISPVRRKSISPRRINRSMSSGPRRLILPHNRNSISPRVRRLISPRFRRSMSPQVRRSISPRNRILSPRGRPTMSPRRSISPRIRRKVRRSNSPRRRSISRNRKRGRSRSPKLRRSKSPRKKSKRSRSRAISLARNRSRSPKTKKSRRTKNRRSPRRKSPKQKKRMSRSFTPDLMLSPPMRKQEVPMWRGEKERIYRNWSESRSVRSRLMSPGWTPNREPSPEPQHLRVFLSNKDKSKRRDKKKKSRDADKHPRHLPDLPSKEVFTSGNNILVSVSFNKDELAQNVESSVADIGKKRKRKSDLKSKKDKLKRRNERKKDTGNKKPVAIIDLEKSPFREITPSPKNVIVLSDSDQEKEDQENDRQSIARNEQRDKSPTQQDRTIIPAHREPFVNSVGPKTPPEPSVKFAIMPKTTTQLRAVNPLHEEELEEGEERDRPESGKENTQKGPNTPPDPPNTPPSSPDAYDPFEPTKSGSATPEPEPAGEEIIAQPVEKTTITLETAQKTNMSADDVLDQRPITPIEKVMALLQSTRNVSPTNVEEEMCNERPPELDPNGAIGTGPGNTPERPASVAASTTSVYHTAGIPRIGVYNSVASLSPRTNSSSQAASNQRIVLPSPSKSSPLKTQPSKLFLAKPSPIKSTPIKPMPAKTLLKLPLPSVKPLPGRREFDLSDSPYSPGSSDFGDLFEPPTDATKSYSKSGGNADIFDSLFGSKPKKSKSTATKVPVKHIKQKGNKTQVGVKVDENNLKILDDLPSSAVEMQVKSKFLKKLNRQERVVEEVKLVLKPHYNKKHVTKEQYKDILRRAVPKICHNKSGEINPSKIQSLVEAYVKKYRIKNKQV